MPGAPGPSGSAERSTLPFAGCGVCRHLAERANSAAGGLAGIVFPDLPMRFLPRVACGLLIASSALGCNAGTVVAPGYGEAGEGPGPDGPDSASFEEDVLPLLESRCGSCHTDEAVAPAFMEGPDVYAAVMGWPDLVVPGEPGASTLVTKGAHRGPAWRAAEERVVRGWIEREGGGAPVGGDGGVGEPPPDPGTPGARTSPRTVDEGDNAVDLEEIGLPGATLEFRAARVALGLHLSDLAFTAGPEGARLVHPELVTWADGTAVPDPDDRFDGVELTIPPGETVFLSTNVLLVDFPEPGALSIRFESVSELR